ncbi:MAG: hypothetical protein LCH92_00030 [Proteobacteria bacterium]|nr:hypothetical protein [Pseudomonadota bacterium]
MVIARAAILVALTLGSGARADEAGEGGVDRVLYRYTGDPAGEPSGVLVDGATGQIARLQHAVNLALLACGDEAGIETDGMFGRQTQQALARVAACPPIAARLPDGSEAAQGAVTEALWTVLLPALPLPDARVRMRALLLAFEGTDITRGAAWNFCQNNREVYDASTLDQPCFTNDPASYLTWGPNGATAGHGHEILSILARIEALDPRLIDSAFGAEAGPVRRLFDLRFGNAEEGAEPGEAGRWGRDGELRRYLCGIYLDLPRREAWSQGFAALGQSPAVQAIYEAVYDSVSFDGGKIRVFLNAWRDAGLEPTEIDFAFFADRAAHTRVRNLEVRRILRRVLAALPEGASPAQVRRGYARVARVTNASQRSARLGRDVAYYIDALEDRLTRAERHAWEARGARRASAVGLSDARPALELRLGPPDGWRATGLRPLTEAEAALCPAPVLNPRRPAARI